jgi:hypothetical protein
MQEPLPKQKLSVGQFVIVKNERLLVTEECDILNGFFATDSSGDEQEYHLTQVDAVCPAPRKQRKSTSPTITITV